MSDRHASLLARRIPREAIVMDRAYVIHSRNGGVGVATATGYLLRRVKFDRIYLFEEIDWQLDATYGTAIPLFLIEEWPPSYRVESFTEETLLAWLHEKEREHAAMIQAAWDEVLGYERRRTP